MSLIINNRGIDIDLEIILNDIRQLTSNNYLKDIKKRGDNIGITCPFHKDGKENNPSCYVYNEMNDPEVQYGWFRCFTCGEQGPLTKLVSYCLDKNILDTEEWLIENYSNIYVESGIDLPEINLKKNIVIQDAPQIDLKEYAYYHPYMFERGLTEEVILKFRIGYNKETNSLTFPVWDEYGRLIGVSERNVKTKFFSHPKAVKKPIYLLDYIISNNIKEVVVCESQLDALKCWTWGIPAVALLGTGSKSQYEILAKSGILRYNLALDGDAAGHQGNLRFINKMPNHVLITVLELPLGKDVGDITKEQFLALNREDKNNYLKKVRF